MILQASRLLTYCRSIGWSDHPPKTCLDHLCAGSVVSGIYDIYPTRARSLALSVYCDQTTDGGGWTVSKVTGYCNCIIPNDAATVYSNIFGR